MAPHSPAVRFPLHLSEVLEEELAILAPGGQGPGPDPWDFAVDHLRAEALSELLARLRRPGDEVCRCLRQRLSPGFRTRLERQDEADEALRQALVEELNQCLGVDELYRELAAACRSDRISLSEEIEILLADPPADRRRFHRLLLEEAVPGTFRKIADLRLAEVYRHIHGDERGLAALCLSGGGIRSSVFSLGVAQELARLRLLHRFDYVSTVSGGGYFGGFLSAWIHRHPRGLDGVSAALAGQEPLPCTLDPEPGPLAHLRNFSNYLSPRLGILSADSWTLASIFTRNLLLHWLVAVPLLLAFLTVPRLYVALLTAVPRHGGFGPLAWPPNAFLLPEGLFVLGAALMTAAVAYIGWHRPSGGERSTRRGYLLACLLPLTLSAVALTVYWAWYKNPDLQRADPGWEWFLFPTISVNLVGWSAHAVPALLRGRARPLAKLLEIPFLVVAGAVGGGLTYLVARRLFAQPLDANRLPWYAVLAVPILLGAFVVGETLFAGLASRWTDDEDSEWWARSAAWILIVAGAWSGVAGIALYGPILLGWGLHLLAPVGGLAGLGTALLARSSLTRGTAGKGGGDRGSLAARLVGLGLAFAAPIFLVILLSALSLGVSWLLASFGPQVLRLRHGQSLKTWHLGVVSGASLPGVALVLLGALAIGLAMAFFIDINRFSLHAMYRNRLIRSFLGASRENRNPNPFTGFDAEDNLEIWRLRQPLFLRREDLAAGAARLCQRLQEGVRLSGEILERHLSPATRQALASYRGPEPPSLELVEALVGDFNRMIAGRFDDDLLKSLSASEEEILLLRRARSDDERFRHQRKLLVRAFQEEIDDSALPRPLHVVNVALNLVAGKRLAWQQRKAESFTFSALHCGSARLGYRAAESYGRGGANHRAVSLGTAIAVSGAAASPNMGYHSSPAITFLMTFFNARLGWWLGNPGAAGARTFEQAHPTLGIEPLLSEALGLTDDRNPYVYLSDGGHFENLGLYEMVLRRCRYIVVVDAGQDRECRFEDLGNAIRKIRIDLGIPIELKRLPIYAKVPEGQRGRYCAVGTIHYANVDGKGTAPGKLLYIKPAVYGDEPRDILHYKAHNAAFPHESTGDQWFSESQFESYRMLGRYVVATIWGEAEPEEMADLPQLFACACDYLGKDPGGVQREFAVAVTTPAEIKEAPANAA
jgi:patatin-like phospholipase